MSDGEPAPKRLTFSVHALAGVSKLWLSPKDLGPLQIDKLELEVADPTTETAAPIAERYQRRRTRLRSLALWVAGRLVSRRTRLRQTRLRQNRLRPAWSPAWLPSQV